MRYVKILAALLLAAALPLLAGCGNASGLESASDAFSSPSLWYVSKYPAGMKVEITKILYFSSGTVTSYNASPGFTYSDVVGKSRQDVLSKALSMDKAQFERSVQSDVASFEQIIATQKAIVQGAQTAKDASSASGNAQARAGQIASAQSAIDAAQKSIENVKSAPFKAPSPVPYELSGSTLSFTAPEAQGGELAPSCQQAISCSTVLSSPYQDEAFSFSLSPAPVIEAGGAAFSGFRVGVGADASYLQTESGNRFEL